MSRDRGGITVWLAGLVALLALGSVAGTAHGAAVLARHRVETAADLAALAAAVHVVDGEPGACAIGRDFAARNGGALTACVVSGEDVEVEVHREVTLRILGVQVAVARARAGPVDRGGAPP